MLKLTAIIVALFSAFSTASIATTTKKKPIGLRLIAKTDRTVRKTNACRTKLALSPYPVRRAYVRGGRAFRLWSLGFWERRLAGCTRELRRSLGVPRWFERVMLCVHPKESSNWYLDGHHDGGLQFAPSTWDSAMARRAAKGLRPFSAYAYQATPAQQIRAAWDLTDGSVRALWVHWAATLSGCV